MEPFKNLFNETLIKNMASAIEHHYKLFDKKSFIKNASKEMKNLELKERVYYIAEKLNRHLPEDFELAVSILLSAVKKHSDDQVGLTGFSLWPFTHYVASYGIDHFDFSLLALKEMTKEFTSEFAIRVFFIKDQKKVLSFFKSIVEDDNEHVRRWVSEGSRPLLPWGLKLETIANDPTITWGLLEILKNDPSAYVRKSVANHINDHSKNHPDFVIEKLLKWHHSPKKSKELSGLIKHASRNLIKKGYPKAFILHGVESLTVEVVHQRILTKKCKLGDQLKVEVTLVNKSKKASQVILDHEIHFLKANKKHSIKVFKGKKINLLPNVKTIIEMKIPIKKVTTRVYYSGKQFWNIKCNGKSQKAITFELSL